MRTPEQCEQAAAQGEVATMAWVHWPCGDKKDMSAFGFLNDSAVRIYWPDGPMGTPGKWTACFGVQQSSRDECKRQDFTCLLAAQLWCESLLAAATAPLHAAEIAGLKAEVARLRGDIAKIVVTAVLPETLTKAVAEARSAALKEAQAALPSASASPVDDRGVGFDAGITHCRKLLSALAQPSPKNEPTKEEERE